MNVMVVGGAGFVGSHLVDRLLAESHAVDVVDDLSSGSLANLAEARAAGGQLKIHHLDACSDDLAALVALRRPEVVFHLAPLPPGVGGAPVLADAVASTMAVLEACRRHGVGKVVTTLPAVALYGEVPPRELPVKEGRAWEPLGPRGIVARALADLFAHHRERHALEYTAIALANVYGPRQRPDGGVVAAFAAALAAGTPVTLHGDGRQTRDFVYIDDVVDALVRAATRGGGLVVNVGTGVATPVRDVLALLGGRGLEVVTVPRSPDDVDRSAVSVVRARIHLAWSPWTELADGLRSR
jgi:UDP-glucose 4-epimerase